MKYEKPYLEEIDLQLEGSFLADATKPGYEGGDKDDTETGGGNGDDHPGTGPWD